MFDIDKLKVLNELDREIAKYILTSLDKVAYMRVRELADATNVSPATVVRFTKKMGYSSFPEFRVTVKQELAKQKKILSNENQRQSLLNNTVFPDDFDDKVESLVEKIVAADLIHCIGIGVSGIMAEYAARQLTTLGYCSFASTSPYFPYLTSEQRVKGSNNSEVCLIFSVSGETIEMVQIARLLSDSKIYTTSVTNKGNNSLSALVDLSLTYDTSYDRVHLNVDLSSQLPVIFFIETVVKHLYTRSSYHELPQSINYSIGDT
ncbi:MurR/RpiR family transcriptional regulator [Enterococcus rivorum]|uniref:RpiR family transcriptional regulator n=1 Tax=Enterococcus rivorum TaxID=762845 RepID=A0A1E5KUN4_9ENTE|nr:MurR/RpiR family transcriptional regulator [Enterococcus rivorum]MBP2100578.1 DNA-binding MurR/RpiR family transcriptional regulator [Enterococcus rivorum]OEH81573.1 hypothetical protein BCR26_16515 [Enterococcus rivorum]